MTEWWSWTFPASDQGDQPLSKRPARVASQEAPASQETPRDLIPSLQMFLSLQECEFSCFEIVIGYMKASRIEKWGLGNSMGKTGKSRRRWRHRDERKLWTLAVVKVTAGDEEGDTNHHYSLSGMYLWGTQCLPRFLITPRTCWKWFLHTALKRLILT